MGVLDPNVSDVSLYVPLLKITRHCHKSSRLHLLMNAVGQEVKI